MTENFRDGEFGNKATGFLAPTQLPRDDVERKGWQEANKAWWEASPMRYDWREHVEETPSTKAYFEEIDRRFLASARRYMPWRNIPFDAVIPFENLADKDVLEIGVGQGTHAQFIAPRCKSFTGIDLTSRAAQATSKRLELFGIPARVLQMDAENMDFPSASFDYIWSWGVIHHSADTYKVLSEMHRVLRPGRTCTVMVYHRSWWYYYIVCGLLKGIAQGKLRRHRNVHRVAQVATDGAIARYYTPSEWRPLTAKFFTVSSVEIYGLKSDIIALPHGRLKQAAESLVPDALARLFTNRLRMGSFLVAHMRKV
jgi:ubiquinone/menaquinone biosynthesis C-methylase UbiE